MSHVRDFLMTFRSRDTSSAVETIFSNAIFPMVHSFAHIELPIFVMIFGVEISLVMSQSFKIMDRVTADSALMRQIDIEISSVLGLQRVQEVAATRIADLITYHLKISRETALCFVCGKGNNGANGVAAHGFSLEEAERTLECFVVSTQTTLRMR